MARAKDSQNGRLEEAIAILIQNQAAFLARASEVDARVAETSRRLDETNRINSERFARIEAILAELVQMMQRLPDAVRERMGFRPPEQSRPTSS